jgi:hypothetical protein
MKIKTAAALVAGTAFGALALACSDATGPAPPVPPSGAASIAILECTGNATIGTVECREHIPPGAARRAILGSTGVKLRSSNVSYDSVTQIFGFDVTLQNLLAEPIGTPDGTTVTGSKAFYGSGPTVTSYRSPGDTGSIAVANPDGYGNFTAAHQPYHLYSQILQPNEISPAKRWQLKTPPTVGTFSFILYVFTARPGEPPTPATAPDTLPATLYASENVGTDLTGMTGTYLRDVVTVLFTPGATLEDRQAAVARAGGTVIGGVPMPDGDGVYYLRIQGDTTAGPLLAVIDRLRALPQVAGASPEFVEPMEGSVDYSFPTDSADYARWKVSPDSVSGPTLNWGLEAMGAPAGWGCETGSAATEVAVVDVGFHLQENPDLAANVAEQHQAYHWPNHDWAHGTEVASIIGARGDNGQGMTGVMWNVHLAVYETASDVAGRPVYGSDNKPRIVSVNRAIADAAWSGARVINVSEGKSWSAASILRIRAGHATAADERGVSEFNSGLRYRIARMRQNGRFPLLVFSAGNDSLEAKWNGYPRFAAEYPDQVLVVGAAEYAPGGGGLAGAPFRRWAGSDYGPLVEIAAPSINIGALDGYGLLKPHAGLTSFAAPMVSGVAGLLFSFDPRLTTPEVKQILLASAARGGRVIDNGFGHTPVAVVNAYEALKMAAERTGAPLCGTRVWGDDAGAVVLRDPVTGRTETLFGGEPVWEVNPLHGGKRVIVTSGDDYLYHAYRWNNGSWQLETPDTITDNMPRGSSAAMQGWWGYSHGQDSTVRIVNTAVSGTAATYQLTFSAAGTPWKTLSFDSYRNLGAAISYCAHHFDGASALPSDSARRSAYDLWVATRGYNQDPCDASTGVYASYRLPTADEAVYSSAGDRAYVVVNYEAETGALEPPYSCPSRVWLNAESDTFSVIVNYTCRDQVADRHSDGRVAYAFGIRHNETTWLPNWNEALANIRYWAVNEAGTEWTAEYEQTSHHMWFGWVYNAASETYSWVIEESDDSHCVTRYQNVVTGLVVHEAPVCGTWRTAQRSGYGALRSGRAASSSNVSASPGTMRRALRGGDVITRNGVTWRISRR